MQLIDDIQASFNQPPREIESGLDIEDGALLQIRKACRLLNGAETLLGAGYYTFVIEASFVAIERSVEFRLLEQGQMQPPDLPGTHPGVYRAAANAGVFGESTAAELADLWREHRAKRIIRMFLPPLIEQSRCANLGQNYTGTSLGDPSRDMCVSVNNENEEVCFRTVQFNS